MNGGRAIDVGAGTVDLSLLIAETGTERVMLWQ